MIVNAGNGLGPMLIPQLNGRTITSHLMRNAVAAAFRPQKRIMDATLAEYNRLGLVESYIKDHGKTPLQSMLED